jgi:uncharacterized membrane protein
MSNSKPESETDQHPPCSFGSAAFAEQHRQAIRKHLHAVVQDPRSVGFESKAQAVAYAEFMNPDAPPPPQAEVEEYERAWGIWGRIEPIDEEIAARSIKRPGESNLEISDRNANLSRLADERAKLLEQLVPASSAVQPPPRESAEERQDRRLRLCEARGLVFMPGDPTASGYRMPTGVGNLAGEERVTRQAFTEDVKKALKRRYDARRRGSWGPQA